MFKSNSISLGTLQVGKEIRFQFDYGDEIDLIRRIQVPCDCTDAHNNIDIRSIVVRYTPTGIPIHLRQQGKNSYNIAKQINVEFSLKSSPGNIETIGLMYNATIIG